MEGSYDRGPEEEHPMEGRPSSQSGIVGLNSTRVVGGDGEDATRADGLATDSADVASGHAKG